MNTRITTKVVGLLLTMFLVGEAFAQVPSSVTQQLRLSTGGVAPEYVQHRAITGAPVAPNAGGYNGAGNWYAWDQVPATVAGTNYLMMLNDQNQVTRTTLFNAAVSNYFVRVNAAGTNLQYMNPNDLIVAQNGLTENGLDTIELGGTLLHNTTINLSTFDMSYTGSGTFEVGDGVGTMNINLDPGAGGFINLQNIDASLIDTNFLMTDATGNVVTRGLSTLIDANNGVTETVIGGVSTVQLGAPATGGSTLAVDRFVSLNGNDVNWEGDGNFNIGAATDDQSLNIHTGALGNVTLQGTTLNGVANLTNFLYTDGTNVRRATAQQVDTIASPVMFMGVAATGEIVQTPNPLTGIYRGKIAGNGGYTYTSPAIANLDANAAIVCTIDNRTNVLGTIIVQVTDVTSGVNGTFEIECSESIQTGSSISYVVMNP